VAKVRKTLLNVGIHHARQGVLKVTPERARRWADNINKMNQLGIKLPVCWAHDPTVLPDSAYDMARLNAGYYSNAAFDPKTGNLDIDLEAPGCELDKETGNLVTYTKISPTGPLVKTAIGEVSGHIRNWKDGQGRDWPDSLVHVALTPLPVVPTKGFTELATGTEPSDFFLSLSTFHANLATEPPMAEEKDKKTAPPPPEDKAPPPDVAADTEPVADDAATTEDSLPAISPAAAAFAPAVAALKSLGLHLPEDTTEKNFAERIVVACHALDAHKAAQQAEEAQQPAPGTPDANGTPPANNSVVEEGRPVMLSTITDGRVKKLLLATQEQKKSSALAKVDSLVKRGMPVFRANEFRDLINSYELALVGDDVQRPEWEASLGIWDETLKFGKSAKERHVKGAKEEPPPHARQAENAKQEEVGDDLSRRATVGHAK